MGADGEGEPTDAALLVRVRAGGGGAAAAFDALAARHHAAVYRVAHRITGSAEDAADVRQEVFTGLFRDPPGGVRDVGAWLRRCAANAAVNRVRGESRRRARHRHTAPPRPAPDPAAAAAASDEAARLRAALAALPPEQRAVLALRYDGGLTFPQVAEALSVPVGTAKDRSRRALAALRARLGPAEESP